jgi:hypothetical protein
MNLLGPYPRPLPATVPVGSWVAIGLLVVGTGWIALTLATLYMPLRLQSVSGAGAT